MALARVKSIFQKYPLLANSAVYGTMCVTAEFSQQVVTKRYFDRKDPPEPIDKATLARYAVVGSCINSNMLYFWYRWLDRNFVGTSMKIVVKKLLLDQFVLTPQLLTIFYVSKFKWLDAKVPGKDIKSISLKLTLHQFALTPPFVAIFFLSMSIMEGKDDLFGELKEKFVPTFKTSCGFWLPAQAINFLVVPPMARVVYVATCSFLWVNILCWIKRNEVKNIPV